MDSVVDNAQCLERRMPQPIPPVGPVDIVVIGFPDAKFDGTIAPAIADLVAAGTIRLLDAVLVLKDDEGKVTIAEVTDVDGDGIPDLIAIQGDIPGLIGEDDAAAAVEELPDGSAIALLAWENTWAIPAVQALSRNGAVVLARQNIPAADVAAVLATDDGQ